MKKSVLAFLLAFSLFSCQKEKKNLIPLYHLENINLTENGQKYHLLYEENEKSLSMMLDKKASFFLAVYAKSCTDTCSTFLYILYSFVNEQNLFLPYIPLEAYSGIESDLLPTLKGNALIFFFEGKPYRQFDFDDPDLDSDVGTLIEEYTYDTKKNIHVAIKQDLSKEVPTYTFQEETETSILTFDPKIPTKTLYLNLSLTSDFSKELKTHPSEEYQAIYPYQNTTSLTDTFYQRTGIIKEDLENRSSYLL